MTQDHTALKIELKELLVSVANLGHLAPTQIDDHQTLFKEGLGLDSIDLLELVVNVEKRYGLKIQNDAEGYKALSNIESLAFAIAKHRQ